MDPVKLADSLNEFVAVLETLLELHPKATPQDLVEYARATAKSPMAIAVLINAVNTLAPLPEPEKQPTVPSTNGRRRAVFAR